MPNTPHHQILQRTVRFSINPDGSALGENSYAGKPSLSGYGRYYEIQIAVKGQPDPQTGYLIGIQHIDSIVREHLIPMITKQVANNPSSNPALLLIEFWPIITDLIKHQLHAICWQLTPYDCIEMNTSTQSTNAVLVRQRFDFAAAHRLHAPGMSDSENAEYFGKCNNLNGHGHNYQLEPCIHIPIELLESRDYQLEIQRAVNSVLLDKLDHKFLNIDCPWFNQDIGGVIPSVENIARVCYEQLAPTIATIAQGVQLVSMCAWETEKTSSIYPANAHETL